MNTASALKMINNASAISKKMKMPPLAIVILDQGLIGAIGISGANSDQDEAFAIQMIESENLCASP